jgi:hypothetical protein
VRENRDRLQDTHRQGDSEGVEFFFGWITFKFARFSWCDT